jgi:hypothetical protein
VLVNQQHAAMSVACPAAEDDLPDQGLMLYRLQKTQMNLAAAPAAVQQWQAAPAACCQHPDACAAGH